MPRKGYIDQAAATAVRMACDGGLRDHEPEGAVQASSVHRRLSHMHAPALQLSSAQLTSGLLARDVCGTAPASGAAEPAVGEARHQPLRVRAETA